MPKNAKDLADGSSEALGAVGALGRGTKSKTLGRLIQNLRPALVTATADDDHRTDPITALAVTAVFKDVVTIPLIYLITRLSGPKDIMGQHRSGPWSYLGLDRVRRHRVAAINLPIP